MTETLIVLLAIAGFIAFSMVIFFLVRYFAEKKD